MATSTNRTLLQRLWSWGCSLKLAIYAASAATALIMGGSLVMNAHPGIFRGMDDTVIGEWFSGAWTGAPQLSWWLPLTALCLMLFGINTLCCLIDWLMHLRSRWRKTGEYLVHTGFLLLLIGYFWGSVTGFRSEPHRLSPGEVLSIPKMPGYALRLDAFEPTFGQGGRPLDMVSRVTLLRHDSEIVSDNVRINHPLLYDGLIVLPTSLAQRLAGFRVRFPALGVADLAPGVKIALPGGGTLGIVALYGDAGRQRGGTVTALSDQVGNPAMQMLLIRPDGSIWQGWHFLRESPPGELVAAGAAFIPLQPLVGYDSVLTVNRDPGSGFALAGGLCLTVGVLLASASFYRKRARGDRPIA